MKALFFLRHYNDIDHVTPIISEWQTRGHDADVVLLGPVATLTDYRIKHLAGLERVSVAHLQEVLGFWQHAYYRLLTRLVTHRARSTFHRLLLRICGGKEPKPQSYWRSLSARPLDRTFKHTEKVGVLAFDWVSRDTGVAMEWVREIVELAHARNISAFSLPHGDSPHANKMIRRSELSLAADTTFANADVFDVVVVPNALCAERFTPHLPAERIAVLGSPRYCDGWLSKLPALMPPTSLTRRSEKLHVVMFLRKSNFTSFWEEIALVARMLAGMPDVQIIIKEHTRSGWKQPLARDSALKSLRQVCIVGDEVHSAHLLDWADIVIDIATSVSFEAVKRGIPVLAADYLHAGLSTVGRYIPGTVMHCRDDVWHAVERLRTDGDAGFYDNNDRELFIAEIIDGPEPDVLAGYVRLLESQPTFLRESLA